MEEIREKIKKMQPLFTSNCEVRGWSGRKHKLTDGVLNNDVNGGIVYCFTSTGFTLAVMNKKGEWLTPEP